MVRGLNKILVIGTLGHAPEMRYTSAGKPVTAFSVATPRGGSPHDGNDGNDECSEDVEWFHVVAWGGLAEVCKRRWRQGAYVYVEGRLQTRCWEGADGQRHYRTELVAHDVIFLDCLEMVDRVDDEAASWTRSLAEDAAVS